MKKPVKLFMLLLLLAFISSCGQNQPKSTTQHSEPGKTDIITSEGPNEPDIYSMYEYIDSSGARLVIQNSFPKSGVHYTDPNGKKYVYAVFFTRIINKTASPLELTIDFPVEPHELPSYRGIYYRLFFPPDTITVDKQPMYDYGLTSLKSFLDNNLSKPATLKRTIGPKEAGAFYVVTLSNKGMDGPIRTGFTFKDQHVLYSINKNEILCGKINLQNLRLAN